MQSQFCIGYWMALVFGTWGPKCVFPKSPDDGTFPGDFDSWAEMSVRVQKDGFMVETLRH